MSLYLAIFEQGEDVEGVEVGPYSDFGAFRDTIVARLESGKAGSRFPTLILHSDCDGEWSPRESKALQRELEIIGTELRRLPPIPIDGGWQAEVAEFLALNARSLFDCFFDVDGEPLVERLIALAEMSQARKLPILLQ